MPVRRADAASADLRVPARLRESTHDSLVATPVTVGTAHARQPGIRRYRTVPGEGALPEGASGGAVVVGGWLVCGYSCVEWPPRAGTRPTMRLRRQRRSQRTFARDEVL